MSLPVLRVSSAIIPWELSQETLEPGILMTCSQTNTQTTPNNAELQLGSLFLQSSKLVLLKLLCVYYGTKKARWDDDTADFSL